MFEPLDRTIRLQSHRLGMCRSESTRTERAPTWRLRGCAWCTSEIRDELRIRALVFETLQSRRSESQCPCNSGSLDLPSHFPGQPAGWTLPPPSALTGPGPSPRLRSSDVIRFADCELNLDRIVLRRGGEEIPIEPQVFDVLAYLVEHRGAVVRKEELLDAIWGDRFVSESTLTTRIKAVRQAVGDDGSRQLIIRTVHGKGYEFVASSRRSRRVGPTRQCTHRDGPSIGVRVQPLIGKLPKAPRPIEGWTRTPSDGPAG